MADPLPQLPDNPLGAAPSNPLGAPPAPPLIGKREPLRFPTFGRGGRSGGGSSASSSPLPTLRRLSQKKKPQPTPTQLPIKKTAAPTAPIVVQQAPRPRPTVTTPTSPASAPVAPAPRTAVERPQRAGQRRTAAEVRDAARGHLSALYGPQIANHPQLGHADIRDRLMKASAADWRGHLAAVHDAALAKANERAQQAQRNNPGYKPKDVQQPAPDPGIPDAVKAKRAAQYAQMKDTLDALRQPPQAGNPGGQP